MNTYTDAQASNFSAAYERLRKARADEEYLVKHRVQIVRAVADGIGDDDLIRALKEAYPEIQVTRRTLKFGGLRNHGQRNGGLLWNDLDHQQGQLARDCAVGRPFHRLVGTL